MGVRKIEELRPFETAADLSGDVLRISIFLNHNNLVSIWNIDNAQIEADEAGEGFTIKIS